MGRIESRLEHPEGYALSGSGADTRVAFFTGTSTLSSAAGLTWDGTNLVATRFVFAASGVSVNSPSFFFSGDGNTGGYWVQADRWMLTAGGGDILQIDSAGVSSIQAFYLANGLEATPSMAFGSDANTGVWRSASDEFAISTGGVLRAYFYNSGLAMHTNSALLIQGGDLSIPGLCINGDPNTGFGSGGADTARIVCGGSAVLDFTSSSVKFGHYHIEPSEYDAGNSSTAITLDWTNGSAQRVTMTGNCTFGAFTNGVAGGTYVLRALTGAGGFTGAFNANVKWAGGAAPTFTATASRVDLFTFYYDGSVWYGSYQQNYTP